MCGFVGFLGGSNGQSWTEQAVLQMVHRGPDSQQTLRINQKLWMGVARLAMTDPLPRANQPFIDSTSGNAISFNGEIYNYREIRGQLESIGEQFLTDSDTEVLLKFLKIFGVESVSRLNGMYSFAYFSKSENALYLVRDRLGKKPLYLKQTGNCLQWSSSQSSFNNRQHDYAISDIALTQYLSLGYLLDPISLDVQVYSVKPGEAIRINVVDGTLESLKPKFDIHFNDSEETPLRSLIQKSVADRIFGHNKVGLSLSGGVDSSIIAIELSKAEAEVTTYSAVWSDSDKERYNYDSDSAKSISESLGLKFRPVDMIKSDQLEQELRNFLSAMEEPNNNPSGVSMHKLYGAMAEDGQRLILTGDGSDEIFGGYQR